MVSVCKVEIQNFRSIRLLTWLPSPGLNCLIGPGDSGKTTILDAIDLCLGARRNVSFSDTDFFGLDVTQPISITLALGSLPDALRTMETYGNFLYPGVKAVSGDIEKCCYAGNRITTLNNLFDCFNFKRFRITLTAHGHHSLSHLK
ncbi:TPA: hypothetical protein I4G32_24125 [Enterobacter hormaechei subsp. oharae]|nr:hypothetical protein ASV12_13570 [Enterobacter hormaechei subsp. xiangfangensis]KTI94300.1 hypothetical protein ASU94_23905 [Enterobacter hormaechei subsp. xiangfangensis]HAS1742912.1 hypothetical protein [Enterobacter hormaechei subsp. oharae]HAS1752928.1 hypothetical protein [Enterobacter hormaechei subsp. oharae]